MVVASGEKYPKLSDLVRGGVDGSDHRLCKLHLVGQAGIIVSGVEGLQNTLSIREI